MRRQTEEHPFVGIGFGVVSLVAPVIFVLMWLVGDLHAALPWGGGLWVGGAVLMAVGYLINLRLLRNLSAVGIAAAPGVAMLVALHGHGHAWLWTLGWTIFAEAVYGELYTWAQKLRSPSRSGLTYEHAVGLLSRQDEIPPIPRYILKVSHWAGPVFLGAFLVLANLGFGGFFIGALLVLSLAASLMYWPVALRYYKRQTS